MVLEVPKILYLQRIKVCFMRMPSWAFFWFLFMYTMGFPFWGKVFDNYWNLYIPSLLFYTVLFYIIPRIRMACIYARKIESKDGNILITYYKFNTKKEVHIVNKFLTVQDYYGRTGLFAIDFFDGKIYKRIFRQHKIGAWAKEENITVLRKMIDPNWTQNVSKSLRTRSNRHPWRDL